LVAEYGFPGSYDSVKRFGDGQRRKKPIKRLLKNSLLI